MLLVVGVEDNDGVAVGDVDHVAIESFGMRRECDKKNDNEADQNRFGSLKAVIDAAVLLRPLPDKSRRIGGRTESGRFVGLVN